MLRRASCLVECSAVTVLKFFIIFQEGVLDFKFALGLEIKKLSLPCWSSVTTDKGRGSFFSRSSHMLKDLCISQGPATWEIVELSLHRQRARTGHSEVDDEGETQIATDQDKQ